MRTIEGNRDLVFTMLKFNFNVTDIKDDTLDYAMPLVYGTKISVYSDNEYQARQGVDLILDQAEEGYTRVVNLLSVESEIVKIKGD
jgi:hypothetical protein